MTIPISKVKEKCNYYFNKCTSCQRIPLVNRVPELPEELITLSKKVNEWNYAPSEFGLRAKARMSVSGTSSNPILGLLDSNYDGIEILSCPAHRPIINKVANLLPNLIKEEGINPYNIPSRLGELKSIILQTNKKENHIRVRFVSKNSSIKEKLSSLAEKLAIEIDSDLSVSLNIQPIPHQIPEGDQELHIYGEELLWETYGNVKIAFPAKSFMQVTPEIAEKLYTKVSNIIAELKPTSVIDLFCGAGAFTLFAAKYCDIVKSFEISHDSIDALKISAEENGFTNIEATAKDLLESNILQDNKNANVIICNPPRRGLGKNLINEIKAAMPEIIIYSSCNVETLLSDYLGIREFYAIEEITPFEMFPLTNHFEVLAVMKKK